MAKPKDEVLTTREVCRHLKISRPTLLKLIHTNQIKARKVGKGWRLMRSELQAYLGESKTPRKPHARTERREGEEHRIDNKDTRTGFREPKATVLVVDDEPEISDVIRDILEWKGFDVEIAENGRQGLDFLMSDRHFDLVVTDMRMSKMDGLELLRVIRQHDRNLPVIILTGYPTVENWTNSLEEGACDYLFKPFNAEKLMSAVVRAVSKSRPDLEKSIKKQPGEIF